MTEIEVYEILYYIEEKNPLVLQDCYYEIKARFSYASFVRSLANLENLDLIVDESNESSYKLTELGINKLNEFKENIQNGKLDKIAERNKLHNESKLSNWQVKTFWPIFIFALFGGLYSTYDIVSKALKKEDVNEKPVSKKEFDDELTKIRALILIKDINAKTELTTTKQVTK